MTLEYTNIRELILKVLEGSYMISLNELMRKLEVVGIRIDSLELRVLISTMVRDGLLTKDVDENLKKFVIRVRP